MFSPMRTSPQPAVVFAVIFVAIFLLHAPLLQLPYFWDEAGYYVPAARDILLSGSFIPHTTPSNAHPPLVMAWVALWWKVAGYAPLVTRSAMLVIAAFSLLGIFRLAERAANTEVAIASTVGTALYPVFFAQSSLAQVDLAAAGLTFWGLSAYLDDRPLPMAVWFSAAALAKETAILAPLALAGWEALRFVVLHERRDDRINERSKGSYRGALSGALNKFCTRDAFGRWFIEANPQASRLRESVSLVCPLLPLAVWYTYHYAHTGYVFGNPEYFRYNVAATLNPLRFLLALFTRLWQAFGYLHLWLLTIAMLGVMLLPPVKDDGVERRRMAISVQMIFGVIVAAYIAALALIGGAVLARYMLTAVPLVIIVAVSTLRRRLRYWPLAIAAVGAAFILGWFWNPPYGFSPEDNLAYRDFVVLHEDADRFVEARYPMARVLTAWPASGELRSPWLGYVTRPMQVVQIEDFSADEVLSAAELRSKFDVALVFSTKYEPTHPLLDRWRAWTDLKERFFGYHRDVPPVTAARILGGQIVFSEERKGLWVAVIEMQRSEIFDAKR